MTPIQNIFSKKFLGQVDAVGIIGDTTEGLLQDIGTDGQESLSLMIQSAIFTEGCLLFPQWLIDKNSDMWITDTGFLIKAEEEVQEVAVKGYRMRPLWVIPSGAGGELKCEINVIINT